MLRSLIVLFICLVIHAAGRAQSNIISGRVTNGQTNEGIPFANVFIKGTYTKVSTDFEGNYKLRLKHPADNVGVSCMGYRQMFKKAGRSAKEQTIDFMLLLADSTLKQKTALSDNELKALVIVDKVIKRKPSHNKRKLNGYGFEAYTKIQMSLTDVSGKFQNRKLFRPFKFIFNNIDSSSENKPFLPFFISETVSDYYFQKKPLSGREIIKATKISGLDDISISQFMGTSFAKTDIYNDYVLILKRQFLSPVAAAGVSSYTYYLEGSEVISGMKCYRIRFVPKSPKLLRLEGVMWVADSVFAIKQINFKVTSGSNVNMINSISVFNEFVPVKDSVWMLQHEIMSIRFFRFKKTPEIVLHKEASYKNFIFNEPRRHVDSLFRNGRPNISVADSANEKSEAYWLRVRKRVASTGNEEKVHKMIDTLGSLKATKNYIILLQAMLSGIVDVGPITIGNIYSLVGKNDIQGWHFKLAVGTNTHFSKSIRLSTYAGYGLMDKKVRYGAEVLWLIKKYPRISVLAGYRYDLMPNPNASSFFTTPEFFTTYGLRRVENGASIPLKLMDNRELKLQFYQEFKYGYSYTVGFKNQKLQPLQNFNFSYHTAPENLNPNTDISAVTITEFSLIQRFSWKERFMSVGFNRYSLGSKFPELYFEYALGLQHVIGSQFNYHKLAVGFNDTRLLGPLGKLRINIESGKIFGTLPYLVLQSPDASETYISWWPGFNTITKYQFTADRFVKVMIDHHLGGLILDRIPGLNKLKFREVWSARMWWGDLTKSNYTANYADMADNPGNSGPIRVQTVGKIPFIEMSAGLENIGGFFRLDAVWRVTHLDPNGSRFSFRKGNFGLRMAFEIQF